MDWGYPELNVILAPTTARARAALVATETALIGLCCGGAVAVVLVSSTHGEVAAPLFRPAVWLFGGAGLLGLVISIAGRVLEVGEAPRQTPVLHRLWQPLIAVAVACVIALFTALTTAGAITPGARAELISRVAAGIGLVGMTALSLRVRTALSTSAPPKPRVAALAQPIAHSLLSGMAGLLFIGLVTGRVTAQLTYHVGVGVTALAAATALSTAITIRGVRVRLRSGRPTGGRWPLAEHGYRLSAITVMIGLLLPAVVVIADLLAARLTLMAMACAMLAVSSHALRYALAITELALPPPRRRRQPPPAEPHTRPAG